MVVAWRCVGVASRSVGRRSWRGVGGVVALRDVGVSRCAWRCVRRGV
ncbi:hypothetical protein ACXZ9C_10895 [Streptococcus agalactiae]